MTKRRVYGLVLVAALFLILSVGAFGSNPAYEISAVLQSFVETANRQASLDPFLAPSIQGEARDQELRFVNQPFEKLEISHYELSNLRFHGEDRAELQADVHWQTKHSDLVQTATLRFVRIGDKWYFSDFEFFRFNWLGVAIGTTIAVVWAGFVLRYFRHWRKHQFASGASKTSWLLVLFLPIVGVVAYGLLVFRSNPKETGQLA
jgi:hypothetical protein